MQSISSPTASRIAVNHLNVLLDRMVEVVLHRHEAQIQRPLRILNRLLDSRSTRVVVRINLVSHLTEQRIYRQPRDPYPRYPKDSCRNPRTNSATDTPTAFP